MSARPPTLREKRRYLLARIDPSGTNPEAKDLYYAVYEAVVSLFGDMSAAAMQPSVIAVEGEHALLRCRRGAEREFVIALSTLTTCRDAPVALRVLAISGTIESLRERVTAIQAPAPKKEDAAPSTLQFDVAPIEVVQWYGHKVDVLEKGFKNTRRLFLTTEDLEIIHATTISDGL